MRKFYKKQSELPDKVARFTFYSMLIKRRIIDFAITFGLLVFSKVPQGTITHCGYCMMVLPYRVQSSAASAQSDGYPVRC